MTTYYININVFVEIDGALVITQVSMCVTCKLNAGMTWDN